MGRSRGTTLLGGVRKHRPLIGVAKPVLLGPRRTRGLSSGGSGVIFTARSPPGSHRPRIALGCVRRYSSRPRLSLRPVYGARRRAADRFSAGRGRGGVRDPNGHTGSGRVRGRPSGGFTGRGSWAQPMQVRLAAGRGGPNRRRAPLPRAWGRFIVPARFASKITICEGAAAMVAKKTAVETTTASKRASATRAAAGATTGSAAEDRPTGRRTHQDRPRRRAEREEDRSGEEGDLRRPLRSRPGQEGRRRARGARQEDGRGARRRAREEARGQEDRAQEGCEEDAAGKATGTARAASDRATEKTAPAKSAGAGAKKAATAAQGAAAAAEQTGANKVVAKKTAGGAATARSRRRGVGGTGGPCRRHGPRGASGPARRGPLDPGGGRRGPQRADQRGAAAAQRDRGLRGGAERADA